MMNDFFRNTAPNSAFSDGAFVFTSEDFARISAMLYEDAGICLSEAKAALVYSRLTKRLRALGLESFRAYCELVSSHSGVDERQKMLAALTTNVTRFFREKHHFDHLRDNVIKPKIDAIRGGGRLRIWSAACSDGQEPYSIAMTVLSVLPDAQSLDVRILATDIDPNMIAAGKAGIYSQDAMGTVPNDARTRWFTTLNAEDGPASKVKPDLAALIAFKELNLLRPWPFKGRFDAIFCRNVVIYFDQKTQQMVWNKFVPILESSGRLYIGHSERLTGSASRHFEVDGMTTYRLTASN